jgi:hypothetical protein
MLTNVPAPSSATALKNNSAPSVSDRPVKDDAGDQRSSLPDAPDIVEGVFDGFEQQQHDQDQGDGARCAGRTGSGGGYDVIDHVEDLGAEARLGSW